MLEGVHFYLRVWEHMPGSSLEKTHPPPVPGSTPSDPSFTEVHQPLESADETTAGSATGAQQMPRSPDICAIHNHSLG